MSLDTVEMIDAGGNPVSFAVVTLSGGAKAAAHSFVDSAGNFVGTATNPLLTAPGIESADFTPLGGTVAVAGATILNQAASTSRTGGYIRAGDANGGNIILTLIKADGVTTKVLTIPAGGSFQFSIAPGRVLQQHFTVAGDTPGDTFEGILYA